MSLDKVDEQLPLMIAELNQFGDQLSKQIGSLMIESEKAQASLPVSMQQHISQLLSELQDGSDKLAKGLCLPLAEELSVKRAQLKSYLNE